MGLKAGALLWNRMRIAAIPSGGGFDVDTGLCQVIKSFAGMSPNEPSFSNPSRIQIIPLAPTPKWQFLTHGEPFFNSSTGTIHVVFANSSETEVTDVNVLFWDPHSMVGPGDADTYNAPIQ